MASKISIYNAVSVQFGKGQINSITESGNSSDVAIILNGLWDMERDSLLREGYWNCAMKRVVLASTGSAPLFRYSSRYPLPSDFIRLYSIGDYYVGDGTYDCFAMESGAILANGTALPIQYIFRNDSVETWDSKLVELMTTRLMWKSCYAITKSTSKEDALQQRYERQAQIARAVDAQENPSEPLSNDFPFLYERF